MATNTGVVDVTAKTKETETGLTLSTDRGITTISDEVVAKLAGHAAREIEGVAGMGATFRRLIGRVKPGQESLTQGVNVEVGKKEAAIDMVLLVRYGYPIPSLAQEVRENVIARIETDTGLIVKEVNIEVDDLQFEEDKTQSRVE
jgi:uncharacterized alkaline shock family protein YloU